MTGTDVTTLQKFLVGEGLFTVTDVTGFFGPKTKKAVQQLQKQYGIVPLTGTVGPLTRTRLNAAAR